LKTKSRDLTKSANDLTMVMKRRFKWYLLI
jgi:hypothetical protein